MLKFIYLEIISNFQAFYTPQTPLYLIQILQIKKTQNTRAFIGITESSTRFLFSLQDLATQNIFHTYICINYIISEK